MREPYLMGPDPHSYISIERKLCLVANQIGIAIVNWEMRFRSWWENRRVFLVWECFVRSFLVRGVSSIHGLRDVSLKFWIRGQCRGTDWVMRPKSMKIGRCVDVIV